VGLGPRGLPLGLQIVAPAGKDHQALSSARFCEKLFSFPLWRKIQ
jgi:Asp-tRNA(Asn)/Glu-tRNA(Gln) amidotransferase A subunit family amidase